MKIELGVMAHAFNPSTWEAEASGSLCVEGQPSLQIEFQESWDYRGTLSHISQKANKQTKKQQQQQQINNSEHRPCSAKLKIGLCTSNVKIGHAAKSEDRLHISKVKIGHAAQR